MARDAGRAVEQLEAVRRQTMERAAESGTVELADGRTVEVEPGDFAADVLCPTINRLLVWISEIRGTLKSDLAEWAKDALPWPLSMLLSGLVAGAVLDGLEWALSEWREALCE